MSKKTSGKGSKEKGKGSHKLTDLAAKRVRGGEAASIKGGATISNEKWITIISR
jgi:hypothetical protein